MAVYTIPSHFNPASVIPGLVNPDTGQVWVDTPIVPTPLNLLDLDYGDPTDYVTYPDLTNVINLWIALTVPNGTAGNPNIVRWPPGAFYRMEYGLQIGATGSSTTHPEFPKASTGWSWSAKYLTLDLNGGGWYSSDIENFNNGSAARTVTGFVNPAITTNNLYVTGTVPNGVKLTGGLSGSPLSGPGIPTGAVVNGVGGQVLLMTQAAAKRVTSQDYRLLDPAGVLAPIIVGGSNNGATTAKTPVTTPSGFVQQPNHLLIVSGQIFQASAIAGRQVVGPGLETAVSSTLTGDVVAGDAVAPVPNVDAFPAPPFVVALGSELARVSGTAPRPSVKVAADVAAGATILPLTDLNVLPVERPCTVYAGATPVTVASTTTVSSTLTAAAPAPSTITVTSTAPGATSIGVGDRSIFPSTGTYQVRVGAELVTVTGGGGVAGVGLLTCNPVLSAHVSGVPVVMPSTTMDVADRTNFPQVGQFVVKVDNEYVTVTGGHGTGPGQWTVLPTFAAHANGATVSFYSANVAALAEAHSLGERIGCPGARLAQAAAVGATKLWTANAVTLPAAPFQARVGGESVSVSAVAAVSTSTTATAAVGATAVSVADRTNFPQSGTFKVVIGSTLVTVTGGHGVGAGTWVVAALTSGIGLGATATLTALTCTPTVAAHAIDLEVVPPPVTVTASATATSPSITVSNRSLFTQGPNGSVKLPNGTTAVPYPGGLGAGTMPVLDPVGSVSPGDAAGTAGPGLLLLASPLTGAHSVGSVALNATFIDPVGTMAREFSIRFDTTTVGPITAPNSGTYTLSGIPATQPRRKFVNVMLSLQRAVGITVKWGKILGQLAEPNVPGGALASRSIRYDASREGWWGILSAASVDCVIDNVGVYGLPGDLVYINLSGALAPATGYVHTTNLEVKNSTMSGCGRQGITINDAVGLDFHHNFLGHLSRMVFDSEPTSSSYWQNIDVHDNISQGGGIGFLHTAHPQAMGSHSSNFRMRNHKLLGSHYTVTAGVLGTQGTGIPTGWYWLNNTAYTSTTPLTLLYDDIIVGGTAITVKDRSAFPQSGDFQVTIDGETFTVTGGHGLGPGTWTCLPATAPHWKATTVVGPFGTGDSANNLFANSRKPMAKLARWDTVVWQGNTDYADPKAGATALDLTLCTNVTSSPNIYIGFADSEVSFPVGMTVKRRRLVLDQILNRSGWSIGLLTQMPDDNGNGYVEVVGDTYARIDLPYGPTRWQAAAGSPPVKVAPNKARSPFAWPAVVDGAPWTDIIGVGLFYLGALEIWGELVDPDGDPITVSPNPGEVPAFIWNDYQLNVELLNHLRILL